jgi:hypothetical protein
VAAVAVRIPALLASRHLGFDDGVYGASALALRDGALPFRDVFSSQGPLFLPLVFLADVLGLRRLNAPRLLALGAAAGVVVAVYASARLLGARRPPALWAAALAAGSGALLWVTGPLTSDGPAVALAAGAVALTLWWRAAPSPSRAALAGATLGAALSVKSLLVPAVFPVAMILAPLWRTRRRDIATVVVAALAVGLAAALPFGLARVWDQSVAYHLDVAGPRTPLANLRKTASTVGDRDLVLVAAVALAVVVSPRGERRRIAPVAVWLATTIGVLGLEHPMWRNHVAHLVPAAALLVALRPPPARWLAVAVAVTLPYHLVHVWRIVSPRPYAVRTAAAVARLRALPDRAWAISDEPGLVWRAGRRTPADLVDTSILRIQTGRITTASLARAAATERVCAVLVWSHRFANLPALPARLAGAGYRVGARYGGRRVLYVKRACAVRGRGDRAGRGRAGARPARSRR